MSEESLPRPVAHTDKPAVIALLHDTDEISFPQLQLILILRHITVQSLETGAGHREKLVDLLQSWEVNYEMRGGGVGLKHRSYSHSTVEATWLWTAAVGVGLLGNDERLFTGVGVQSMDRVMRVAGQGAAVPYRGLGHIQDLITHCLLVVE